MGINTKVVTPKVWNLKIIEKTSLKEMALFQKQITKHRKGKVREITIIHPKNLS